MMNFKGSVNLHIILKTIRELLQEKCRYYKYFLIHTKDNLDKSKIKLKDKSYLDALETEIKQKKELCDKLKFEKELAYTKVKNLKKSVFDINTSKHYNKSI